MPLQMPFRRYPVAPDPAEIQLDREGRELVILWQDGHRSAYPFDFLRKECPCALCSELRRKREQGELAVITGPVVRPGEASIEAYTPVGRYALNFAWNDGHNTGIYSFDLLRAICPCEACRSAIGR